MKKRFKTIYYVVQTVPCVKTCGQTFDKKTAKYIADQVQQLTGSKGFIIKFKREELEELNFKQ